MSRDTSSPTRGGSEPGFALLALLLVVGVGSLAIVLAAQQFVPALADRVQRTEGSLAQLAAAAREGFLASGALPNQLDTLAAQTGWETQGEWRVDPWGWGQEFVLTNSATAARVQSRGPDGALGTADDVAFQVPLEPLVRLRQRDRLRLVRAVYVRQLQAAVDAAAVAAAGAGGSSNGRGAERASARARTRANANSNVQGGGGGGGAGSAAPTGLAGAVRLYASAKRQWCGADAQTRVQLAASMATAAATVTACQVFASWSQPVAVTGAGGLCSRLGLPDALARDGLGQALHLDPILGVVAVGNDGVWGTDDDM